MRKVFIMAAMSLLISMYVLLSHIVPVIQIESLRVSFGFVPLAFGSMLFGPLIGAVIGALGDIIGALAFPKGPFFPGLTLDVFLSGIIYGIFLYKKPKSIIRISLAVLCVNVFVNMALNTYWLTILLGKGYLALLPGRIVKNVIMMPVQISILYLLWKYAGSQIEKIFLIKPTRA